MPSTTSTNVENPITVTPVEPEPTPISGVIYRGITIFNPESGVYGYTVEGVAYVSYTLEEAKKKIDEILDKIVITPPEPPEPPTPTPFGWYGFAEDLEHGLIEWRSQLTRWFGAFGAGTHRIAVRPTDLGITWSNFSVLDSIVQAIYAQGGQSIIDIHIAKAYWPSGNPLFGSPSYREVVKNIASHYKGDNRVAALELANEPSDSMLAVPLTRLNVTGEYSYCTQLVHDIDPLRICIWNSDYFAGVHPPVNQSGIVVTFHPYAYSSTYGSIESMTEISAILNKKWQAVQGLAGSNPIWMGELEHTTGTIGSLAETYYVEAFKKARISGYGFNYWRGGRLHDDGGSDPIKVLQLSGFSGK